MTFFRTLSIPNVFRRLLFGSGLEKAELPSTSVTPEALWRARERLGSLPMKVLFRKMAEGYTPTPSFLGFRLWGFDGSYFTLPDTPANTGEFGKKGSDRGSAAYPQMLSVYLLDLAGHRVRDCDHRDCHASERALISGLLSRLGPGDLIMVDRGISSYRLFLQCQKREIAFWPDHEYLEAQGCQDSWGWRLPGGHRTKPIGALQKEAGRVGFPHAPRQTHLFQE